jgi:hypothetical protein
MIDAQTWPRGDRGFAKAVALPPQMQKPVSNIQPFCFVLFHSFLSISSIIIRVCKGEDCTCAFLILLTCHPQSLEVHSKFRVIY